jgi:hypothetical protein
MQVLDVIGTGKNFQYQWPEGPEIFQHWIEHRARSERGMHIIRIGFGTRHTYGQDRRRVLVWIDKHPHAEFVGADDFENSGDVLAEVKVPGARGERMCRYPDESVPARYAGLPVVGLPTRVQSTGVHNAWAIVVNVSDHRILAALAALRRAERKAQEQRPANTACTRRRSPRHEAPLVMRCRWPKEEERTVKAERAKCNRAGRANREARLDASEETGLSADLANRASAAVNPDRARRRRTIGQQGAPPDWRGCMVSASG